MCLAIPGKVIRIINGTDPIQYALIEVDGVQKEIGIAWVDVKVGEYILAHTGLAMSVIDEQEAMLTLNALKQIGDVK